MYFWKDRVPLGIAKIKISPNIDLWWIFYAFAFLKLPFEIRLYAPCLSKLSFWEVFSVSPYLYYKTFTFLSMRVMITNRAPPLRNVEPTFKIVSIGFSVLIGCGLVPGTWCSWEGQRSEFSPLLWVQGIKLRWPGYQSKLSHQLNFQVLGIQM